MELQTISQVSKHFSISTRTLRYYEQIGLLAPVKKEYFAYRVYDIEAIIRLRQIIILRKLRIPLKQIAEILQSEDARVAIEAFERSLIEIEDEITALSTIRSVIKTFVEHLNLGDAKFVLPDWRFGFDCSKGATGIGEPSHIYEVWVSVPNDIEIPAPLVKRTFNGGLYAAHVLRTWDFEDWRLLKEWVNASDKYDNDWDSPRWTSPETSAGQGFEETLNFYNYSQNGEMKDLQVSKATMCCYGSVAHNVIF